MNYQDINARTIDRWIEAGWEWGTPISHEIYLASQRGAWDVLLTPTKAVPHAWFGELRGKRVLGLASGGGPHAAEGVIGAGSTAGGKGQLRQSGCAGEYHDQCNQNRQSLFHYDCPPCNLSVFSIAKHARLFYYSAIRAT